MNHKTQSRIRHIFLFVFLFILLYLLLFVLQSSASSIEISGVVVDEKNKAINNAIVCVQGSSYSTRTDPRGQFRLTVDCMPEISCITAGKFGFYNGAQSYSPNVENYHIILKSIPPDDHENYQWLPSLNGFHAEEAGENRPCEVCHPEIVKEWKQDAHSGAANNAVFFSFFNGTDKDGGKITGPGYRRDFPNSNGNCATCHMPVLAVDGAFNMDPNKVRGVAQEGIFCDFCHKINGVKLDKTGANPGVLSITFQRPEEGRQLFYGPFADVFPGEDGYHPLYKKSHYCAPCHHGKFWGVLAYSEFQEWLESSYRTRNIHCQNCHMPSLGTMTHFALKDKGGILRNPGTIPSHINPGIQDKAFMKEAIDLRIQADTTGDVITVFVTIRNVKAGHHYPTGNPMRNMILIVYVRDAENNSLSMIQGETVPVWGGLGSVKKGNYSGLPGKGFAKVLRNAILYPDNRKRHFTYEYPAPHWRPTVIESDNRIPAGGVDISSYQFQTSDELSWPINVSARLIFRRGYKQWFDQKGIDLVDMEIASDRVAINR